MRYGLHRQRNANSEMTYSFLALRLPILHCILVFVLFFLCHAPLSGLNLGARGQDLQHLLRISHRLLDDSNQTLEARVCGIAQALVHPALARRHSDSRSP